MTQPNKEQIQFVWEQCGLVFKDEVGYHGWYKELGEFGLSGLERVYVPDIDSLEFLGFLFKYAVPKVYGIKLCCPSLLFDEPTYEVAVWATWQTLEPVIVYDPVLKDAMWRAIYKTLGGKE